MSRGTSQIAGCVHQRIVGERELIALEFRSLQVLRGRTVVVFSQRG